MQILTLNRHDRPRSFTLTDFFAIFFVLQQHWSIVVVAVYPPANNYQNGEVVYNRQVPPQNMQAAGPYDPLSHDHYSMPQYGNNFDSYRKNERNVPQNQHGNQYQNQQHQQQQQQNRNYQLPSADYPQPTHQLKQQHNQQQQQQQQHKSSRTNSMNKSTLIAERTQHKCPIWVPYDAVAKYPLASKMQDDQSKQESLIEVCCPGFGPILWRGSTICRPVCKNCQNGFCTAPGECQCYDEFVRNDNGDCVFTCPLGCLNGRCYLDGSCKCDPGYKLDATRTFCRPICSVGCGTNPRHNCTEPELCGCAKGYQLSDNGCQPYCQPDCGFGGRCLDNNICDCAPGYSLKNGVCQSDCYQKCENGTCYGRNRCICNPGYTYHERSTVCIPI